MSKFLKFIVNIILIAAIIVAGGLLIPPFAGVTTVIVDDVNMDTNLEKGSVTYAVDMKESVKIGQKVLVNEGDSQYVYEVEAIDGDTYTLEDKLSTDGGTEERTLSSATKKVLFTVPFIGYASMALRTMEGLIIVGLAVVFLIILFILAEVWKKDDEDEDEDEDDADEEEDEEDDEEPQLSRRQQKKARKAAAKEEKAAAKAAKKEAKRAAKRAKKYGEEPEEEMPVQEEAAVEKEEMPSGETAADEKAFIAETESFLAADIASMMAEEGQQIQEEVFEEAAAALEDIRILEEEMEPEEEPAVEMVEKKIAMPICTKEELLLKAKTAGDEPNVIEDEISGITLLDYSDIL